MAKIDFLSLKDFSGEEIGNIIEGAIQIKQAPAKYADALKNKAIALLFQKTSTRTRCSFEAAANQMGATATYLDWGTTNFTLGNIKDETKCLSQYFDLIIARVYFHNDLLLMAEASSVPVINGLSDFSHPCQALADILTMKELSGKLKGLKLAFIGDGNNVCNSLLLSCTKLGIKMAVATPKGYGPKQEIVEYANQFGEVEITNNPQQAAENADYIYTDTWVSMGQEAEAEKRLQAFKNFQVNSKLVKNGNSNSMVMHCLPAHRGLEITSEVLDSEKSIAFKQSENRLHAQKAIMLELLKAGAKYAELQQKQGEEYAGIVAKTI